MKIINKFYVGSRSILSRDWAHPTLEEAIEHGKELAEETGEPQIVVEIVRLIKIVKPVSVEEV